jgi:hypothetical protein
MVIQDQLGDVHCSSLRPPWPVTKAIRHATVHHIAVMHGNIL